MGESYKYYRVYLEIILWYNILIPNKVFYIDPCSKSKLMNFLKFPGNFE